MTGEELRAALIEFYGEAWRSKAPAILGITERSLDRQISGESAVAGPLAAWVSEHRDNIHLRQRKAVREKASKDRERRSRGAPTRKKAVPHG